MDSISSFSHVDPALTAVVIGDNKIDYGRFMSDIEYMASWMCGQGLAAGHRVGILISQPYWAWVCHLAALRLGLTHATFTNMFRQEAASVVRFDAVLSDSKEAADSDIADRLIVFAPKGMAPLSEHGEFSGHAVCSSFPNAEDSAVRLAFTSGTTGSPKAVLWDARMIRKRVDLVRKSRALDNETCLLPLLGMDTTGGFRYPLAVWQSGGCVLFGNRIAGAKSITLPLGQSNLLLVSPQRLQKLLSVDPNPWDGRKERKVVVAGGRLPLKVREDAMRRACRHISIAYGSTETGSIATGDGSLIDRHPGAVGFIVQSAEVQIVDRQGNLKPSGEKGIVRTRTSCMVSGYEGIYEASVMDAFKDGWFYPGDHGIMFEDGLLAITGRGSETLNIGGGKISLLEFEAQLAQLQGIEDACAVALRMDAADRLAIVVVCDESVDLKALSQEIKKFTPFPFSHLLRVPKIPRNSMGKVARNAISSKLSAYYRGAMKADSAQ